MRLCVQNPPARVALVETCGQVLPTRVGPTFEMRARADNTHYSGSGTAGTRAGGFCKYRASFQWGGMLVAQRPGDPLLGGPFGERLAGLAGVGLHERHGAGAELLHLEDRAWQRRDVTEEAAE